MIEFKLYNTAKDLPKETWNSLTSHDVFLQQHYLEAFEKVSPTTISMYYLGVFNDNRLAGVAIIQRVQLYLKDMFRNGGATCFKEYVKKVLSRILKGNILVVGNLTHTGQHGIYYDKSAISQTDFINTIFRAVNDLQSIIKIQTQKRVRMILFKDYFEKDMIHLETGLFESERFYKLKVQPNMIMHTRNTWLNEQDYVADKTTKYRTRYKRARKRKKDVLTKELTVEDLKKYSETIYSLYKNVSNNASFNTFILPENHFLSLKENLLEDFRVFGYFLEDHLIGFYSLILNKDILETYFLGYDSEHQYTNQLYLNMLYDMASFAIDNKFKTIVYARTAMEIKSSVGASPKQMFIYLKLTNLIANTLLKQGFNLMNPKQEWKERNPFKKEKPLKVKS